MFRQIKDALFVNNKMGEKQEKNNYDEVEIAIAALLVEAACSDGVFDDEERKSIKVIRSICVFRFLIIIIKISPLSVASLAQASLAQSSQGLLTRGMRRGAKATWECRMVERK